MNLNDRINEDIKKAMKEKDNFKLGVIRMVKGAIQLAKINLKHELSDEEVIEVISKQIKMRKDSMKEFSSVGRNDLAQQNEKEIEILNQYMPEQLSNAEIEKIISEAFEKINPTSQKQMGLIMKEISPKLKGKADMGEVNKIIKSKLESL